MIHLILLTLAASFEPVPPADLSEGRLIAAPLHGSAVCALPDGAWQQIVDEGAIKGWVCTDGEIRMGLMPQGTSRAPMTNADAEKMLAGAASRAPAGVVVSDKGWAREALPAGEAIRVWVAMSGADGVSVMHSLYLPGNPAIGFVYMNHTGETTPPAALLTLARSFRRAP